MILCDTNILIEFYKNNIHIVQELQAIGQDALAVSVITGAELYFGAIDKKELASIRRHLSLIQRCPVDGAISSKFIDPAKRSEGRRVVSRPRSVFRATSLLPAQG